MSTGPTTEPDPQLAAPCRVCNCTGPKTCEQCGGREGVPGIPPCLRCKLFGGAPTGEEVTPTAEDVQRVDQIIALGPDDDGIN